MAVDAKRAAQKHERGDDLTSEEARFLQDRGVKLETPVPVVFGLPGGGEVSNDPFAVLQNLRDQQEADISAEVERRVEAELARIAQGAVTDHQHQQVVDQTPHTGTANHQAHPKATPINPNPEDLENDDEDEDEGETDEADEGEEDYDEGWNNDERRAELAKRGLATHGNKDELCARLVRSDNDELEDTDKG